MPLQLSVGEQVCLYATQDDSPQTEHQLLPVDFRELFDSVQTGDRLLLDDGRLALEVISVNNRNTLTARVVGGGPLTSHKGINLPGVHLRISGFTEKDEADLEFGISQDVDAVAISFVRTADDVKKVRYAMERFSKENRLPLLIAKLEKPEAMNELEAILDVVDGVMVARGDLGVVRVRDALAHPLRGVDAADRFDADFLFRAAPVRGHEVGQHLARCHRRNDSDRACHRVVSEGVVAQLQALKIGDQLARLVVTWMTQARFGSKGWMS